MKAYVLGFDGSYASALVGLMDIFSQAGRILAGEDGQAKEADISIKLASPAGKPVRCQNSTTLEANCGLEEIGRTDVLIIPPINDVVSFLSKYPFLSGMLAEHHERGATLASICTGAFLLAETGLLDGKEATTHWSMSDEFRVRFPKVRLRPDKLVINHGDILCAGGNGASADMAYCLLERYLGHGLAARTAKFFVHDFRRVSQTVYQIYQPKTGHGDQQILKIQHWIKEHISKPLKVSRLAHIACMSLRTFERRFKRATNDTPQIYIQKLKVEEAKRLLETTNQSFDEISYQLGYINSGSFRKIFLKRVILLPSQYRKRFGAYS